MLKYAGRFTELELQINVACFRSIHCAQKRRRGTGAPNDGFLPNALKRCFRLSGVLLKLCRLILGCAIKLLSVRLF